MKKLVLAFVMLFMATSVFAQNQESNVRVPNGYQGFLEYGNSWHFDKNMHNSINLSTTHGFYFNGHIYAGIGIGVDFNSDHGLVPIYTNVRYQFNNNKVASPVVSLRLGSFVGDEVGAYGDLAFGVRFASKKDFAINVMVAGTYYDNIRDSFYEYNEELGHGEYVEKAVSPSGISLRIGIEW
jgi:hypothetical protein